MKLFTVLLKPSGSEQVKADRITYHENMGVYFLKEENEKIVAAFNIVDVRAI